jgi:xylulokinase
VPFYLGFDASTQSLTAILIEVDESRRSVAALDTFRYDEELPQYGTTHGAIRGPEPGVVTSPPAMWAEALERMIARLARAHPREVAGLAAVAISAQQHGSVYLKGDAAARLAMLDPRQPLAPQFANAFSRPVAPIWMDSSTTAECEGIARAVGGHEILARRTGSRAFERFTGPQIRKWATENPIEYAATSRIDLVSSLLTSLLIGAPAPLDPGDAAGMNLMDLAARDWWPAAANATAVDLMAKLPAIVDAKTIVGTVSPYWQRRYALPPARVVVGTGDNPSSLIGTGLVTEGHVAVSLGTSNTLFGLIGAPTSGLRDGHIFGAPTGGFMGLTCFANGSLAREHVRDRYHLAWEEFSDVLRHSPPGNRGRLMLPWLVPEITPHVAQAEVRRRDLDEHDAAANVRAVVEAQMMAMANHTDWMGVSIREISATGGASANHEILQVMADVFGATVSRLSTTNSACLGAALRARHADVVAAGGPDDWPSVIAGFVEPATTVRVDADPAATDQYVDLRRRYAAFEEASIRPDSHLTPSSSSTTS